MTTPQKPIVSWNKPETAPNVKLGEEEHYWIAIESEKGVFVFSAYYQNRPRITDEYGDPTKECEDWLLDCCGELIESVGWVRRFHHPDYEGFYELIEFDDKYKLLGWAEYETPDFLNTPYL